MNSKAGKIAIVAGGVIAVGATLAYIWKKFIDVDDEEEEEKPTVAAAEKKEEDIPNLPVPKKQMIKIFSEISESMEMIMMQLSKYEEQLSQNPSYTPEMINQEISSKLELMLTGVEENIYQMNNVKKEDVNVASEMLQNDRDFKRATYRIRSIFAMMQGQTPEAPDLPEFMTLSYTLEVMKEVMTKAGEVMAEVVKEMKEKSGIVDNEEFKKQVGENEEMQKTIFENYMTRLDAKRLEILDKFNIDKAILQIAMMSYQNDPSFQQAMIEVSQNQQKQFQELGFAM